MDGTSAYCPFRCLRLFWRGRFRTGLISQWFLRTNKSGDVFTVAAVFSSGVCDPFRILKIFRLGY